MNTKNKSNKQEKKVAKELKGKTVIASGALWGAKSDVRTDNILVECKTTSKDFYSLTVNTWLKVRSEAINDGLRIPVMCIDLEDGKTRLAVFERGAFSHYKDFYEYSSTFTTWTDKKSVRVTASKIDESVIFRSVTPSICLEFISWDNFIKIIESGENNTNG